MKLSYKMFVITLLLACNAYAEKIETGIVKFTNDGNEFTGTGKGFKTSGGSTNDGLFCSTSYTNSGGGAAITEFSTDGTMSDNSDTKLSTQKAIKTQVKTKIGAITNSMALIVSSPDSDADAALWRSPNAITLVGLHVLCVGGTSIIGNLTQWGKNASGSGTNVNVADITANVGVNADVSSFSNGDIDGGNYVGWTTTSVNGTPDRVIITFDYTIDQ